MRCACVLACEKTERRNHRRWKGECVTGINIRAGKGDFIPSLIRCKMQFSLFHLLRTTYHIICTPTSSHCILYRSLFFLHAIIKYNRYGIYYMIF